MPSLRNGDVDLYYEVHGDGPPLVLVAGLAADGAFWQPALPALAARRQVVLVDNRGSGRTTPLDAASSIPAMADDCMALVRHLGLRDVALVGHSMGGMIAQDCAVRYPDAIDRLVLVATGPVASARDNDLFATWARLFPVVERGLWFRNLFHWVLSARFFASRAAVDALVTLATTYPYQQTAAALAGQVRAIAEFDNTQRLGAIRARTHVLAGTEDLLFPLAASAAFARAIPHATFAAVEGAAHSFPIEIPEEFARRVLAALDAP